MRETAGRRATPAGRIRCWMTWSAPRVDANRSTKSTDCKDIAVLELAPGFSRYFYDDDHHEGGPRPQHRRRAPVHLLLPPGGLHTCARARLRTGAVRRRKRCDRAN